MHSIRFTLILLLAAFALPAQAQVICDDCDPDPVLKPDGALSFKVRAGLGAEQYALTNRSTQDIADALDYAVDLQFIAQRGGGMGMAYGIARDGVLVTGVVSDDLRLVPGGPELIRLGHGPVTNLEDPLLGIWGTGNVGLEDPLLGLEDPLLGFEDPLLGLEDPLLGFEDPLLGIWGTGNVGFEDPLLGFEDPLLGLEAVWNTAAPLATSEYAYVLVSYPLENNGPQTRFSGSAVVIPFDLVDGGTGAEAPTSSVTTAPDAALRAYPNPSRGTTTLAFTLETDAPARLAVYDVRGRQVAVLADGFAEAGRHTADLDAAGLPAGVYLARLSTAHETQTQRFTIVR